VATGARTYKGHSTICYNLDFVADPRRPETVRERGEKEKSEKEKERKRKAPRDRVNAAQVTSRELRFALCAIVGFVLR